MELSSRLLRQARIEREYTVMKKALNKKVLSVLIAAVILLVTAFPVLAADPFKLTSSAEAKDSVVTVKFTFRKIRNSGRFRLHLNTIQNCSRMFPPSIRAETSVPQIQARQARLK